MGNLLNLCILLAFKLTKICFICLSIILAVPLFEALLYKFNICVNISRPFEDGNHILFGLKRPMPFNVSSVSWGLRLILTVFLPEFPFKKAVLKIEKSKAKMQPSRNCLNMEMQPHDFFILDGLLL